MDWDLARTYTIIFAPTAVALLDMFRFRARTWRRAGERRPVWFVLVLLAPWLGPGFYVTGARRALQQAVVDQRAELAAASRPPRREFRVVLVESSEDKQLERWRAVHEKVASAVSAEDVAEQVERSRLTLAYLDDELVGSATVRPPEWDDEGTFLGTATVVVRNLPEHRHRGLGTAYLDVELAVARGYAPLRIETVVPAADDDGLAFAAAHGFEEHERSAPGVEPAVVHLHLAGAPGADAD